MMTSRISVQRHIGADALAQLEEPWRSLERRTPDGTPFQCFDWCYGWVMAAGSLEEPRVVTVWEDDRLVLVWPLAVRRTFGCRVGRWLGDPLTQYGDVLVETCSRRKGYVSAAWGEISRWRDLDLLHLARVRADAAVAEVPAFPSAHDQPADAAPFINFAEAGAGQRSSRTLSGLRRKLKGLERGGAVALQLVEEPAEQRKAVTEALQLKGLWLQATGQPSTGLSHPAARQCLDALAEKGGLFIARLLAGGRTAAIEVGFLRGRRYFSFLQAYDLGLTEHAPGRLLFWQLFEQAHDLGIDVFDFLPPAYAHKREWANGEITVRDAAVPLNSRGRLVGSYFARVRPLLKRAHARLPIGVRRRLAGLAGQFS